MAIPLFFDDLREDGIRDVFFPKLINNRFLVSDSSSYIGKKINANLKNTNQSIAWKLGTPIINPAKDEKTTLIAKPALVIALKSV